MTKKYLEAILCQIKCKDYMFQVQTKGDGFLLQVAVLDRDRDSGVIGVQKGRKWYISSHAIRQEVVRTAFKAVLAYEEHEICEHFKYEGNRIFSPHQDPDFLMGIPEVVR